LEKKSNNNNHFHWSQDIIQISDDIEKIYGHSITKIGDDFYMFGGIMENNGKKIFSNTMFTFNSDFSDITAVSF